ncbi:MAG: hypothetical protein EOP45_11100 [Sphingobacteriaceae bacterium]|nr:MAG: hypothetical protein EOP45_11100 [Sphingobacteriaceae bacterium]
MNKFFDDTKAGKLEVIKRLVTSTALVCAQLLYIGMGHFRSIEGTWCRGRGERDEKVREIFLFSLVSYNLRGLER